MPVSNVTASLPHTLRMDCVSRATNMQTGRNSLTSCVSKRGIAETAILQHIAMFDKFVGGSEAKIRSALQMVNAMPNALLMIDEIK